MTVLAQTQASTVGLVNAAVVALVIVFLTLPTVFVLAEYLRNKRNRSSSAIAIATSDAPAPEPAPAGSVTLDGEVQVVPSATVAHDFTREPVPRQIGYLAPGTRRNNSLTFQGHLQIAARCTITGDVHAAASIALGDGATVLGDVHAGGNLYLRPGARIEGAAQASGNGFLAAWSRLREFDAAGTVELEQGAGVETVLLAQRVVQVNRVDDPRRRADASTASKRTD